MWILLRKVNLSKVSAMMDSYWACCGRVYRHLHVTFKMGEESLIVQGCNPSYLWKLKSRGLWFQASLGKKFVRETPISKEKS
jgi:hypothetical protein